LSAVNERKTEQSHSFEEVRIRRIEVSRQPRIEAGGLENRPVLELVS